MQSCLTLHYNFPLGAPDPVLLALITLFCLYQGISCLTPSHLCKLLLQKFQYCSLNTCSYFKPQWIIISEWPFFHIPNSSSIWNPCFSVVPPVKYSCHIPAPTRPRKSRETPFFLLTVLRRTGKTQQYLNLKFPEFGISRVSNVLCSQFDLTHGIIKKRKRELTYFHSTIVWFKWFSISKQDT